MPDTGDKGIFDGAIIGPFGKGFVDGAIVDLSLAIALFGHGQALSLHTGVEHPQDEIEESVIAEFALGSTLWHRQVRQDKFVELRFRELHGNRRGCWFAHRRGHDEMALFEEGSACRSETLSSNRIIL